MARLIKTLILTLCVTPIAFNSFAASDNNKESTATVQKKTVSQDKSRDIVIRAEQKADQSLATPNKDKKKPDTNKTSSNIKK